MDTQRPICIAGMHRSGTSMVARLLNQCGLYLGPESALIGPQPDNPDGFWENAGFVEINNRILDHFGGAWDFPPVFPDCWESKPALTSIRERAEEVLKGFKEHSYWGWKDPRNSLTIPFWSSLVPGLKYVICLRNPLEVAHSLQKRGYSSLMFSSTLWLTYNQSIIASARPGQRIITHYDAYFENPRAELERVLDFLGMTVSEETIGKACESIISSLRHSRLTLSDIVQETTIRPEVAQLYKDMCEETGPIHRALFENENSLIVLLNQHREISEEVSHNIQKDKELVKLYAELTAYRKELVARDRETSRLINEIDSKNEYIKSLEADLKLKNEQIHEKEKLVKAEMALKEKCVEVINKQDEIILTHEKINNERERLETELKKKDAEINEILRSQSWRITAPIRGFLDLLKR